MNKKNGNQTINPIMRMEEECTNWCVGELRMKFEEFKSPNITITTTGNAAALVLNSINKDELKIQEHFYAIYLDPSRRVLGFKTINVGESNKCTVNVKLLFSIALVLNASSIIIFHNHPSDNLTPSSADIYLTQGIVAASILFDIEISDHIILTHNAYCSMRYDRYFDFTNAKCDYRDSFYRKIDDTWSKARRIRKERINTKLQSNEKH